MSLRLSSAMAFVSATIGTMPGRIFIWSGSRPAGGPRLHVAIEFLRRVNGSVGDENDFRPARGKVAAAIGCSGLDENRPALRRAADIERSAHIEPLAAVIDGLHQTRIGKLRRLGIEHEGAVAPAVPELADDIEKLVGPVVALVTRELVLQPEIGGLMCHSAT